MHKIVIAGNSNNNRKIIAVTWVVENRWVEDQGKKTSQKTFLIKES
jgi:aminopeptidase C